MKSAYRIIKMAIEKQPVGVADAFNRSMRPAISKVVDIRRAEIGANLFAKPESK